MDTPFDKGPELDALVVRVNDTFYRDNEILAYFGDILNSLLAQEKSAANKSQMANMARVLIKKREHHKASGVIFQGLTRYPDDPEFSKLKAEVFIKVKDYASALETVEQIIKAKPYDVSILMMKARIHSLTNDNESEEKVYKYMLDIPINDYLVDRGKVIALRHLADLYFKQKRYAEAEEIAKNLLNKAPDESTWAMYFSILAKLGKKEEAQESRDKFARYTRARTYFDVGAKYEMQNKFSLALTNYRKGLELYPDDPLTNMKVGSILMYRKKWYSRAEEYIRKAVELDPEQGSYRSALVLCLKNQDKLKQAFEEAKIAEKLDPLSNIHYLRQMAAKLGRKQEFIEIVKKDIEIDEKGGMPSLRYELGLFYKHQGDKEQAVQWFKKARDIYLERLKSFSGNWEMNMELGYCYLNLGQYKEAETVFLNALKLAGGEVEEIYEGLIEVYQKTHQPEKSTWYLQKMVSIHPTSVVNYIDLGINYLSRITSSMRKKDKEE
jgi:tetratricopeptide (TPR) repeat protein